MPVSKLHAQVASVALTAAARHGFALGGGNALLAHGIITRPTQDVDLFTNQEHGVEAAGAGSSHATTPTPPHCRASSAIASQQSRR